MARALDIGARLPRGQATPHPILPTAPSAHTPDPYGLTHAAELRDLRRRLDDAYTTFQEVTDPLLGDALWREVLAMDARMQVMQLPTAIVAQRASPANG